MRTLRRILYVITISCLLFFCCSLEVFADLPNNLISADAAIAAGPEGLVVDVPEGTVLHYTGSVSVAGPLVKTGGGTLVIHLDDVHIPILIVKTGTVESDDRLLAGALYIGVLGDGTSGSAVLRLTADTESTTVADFMVIDVAAGGRLETPDNGYFVLGHQWGGYGIINISGQGSSFVCAGPLQAGVNGYGAVNISDGGVMTFTGTGMEAEAWWGYAVSGYGVLKITGPGSALYAADAATGLHLGGYGRSVLRVVNGGQLRTKGTLYLGHGDGGLATGDVNGVGTLVLCDGLELGGAAEAAVMLTISGGARIVSTAHVYIDGEVDNILLTVDGPGSLLYGELEMLIGETYHGSLYLRNGAQAAINFSVIVGANLNEDSRGGGYVHLDGPGTRLYCDNNFYISSPEDVEMRVSGGAALQILGSLDLGRVGGQGANVYVYGEGTRLLVNYVSVGCDGVGLLSVSKGAEAQISRGLDLGRGKAEDKGCILVHGEKTKVSAPGFKQCAEDVTGRIAEEAGGRYFEVGYEAFEDDMNKAMNWDRDLMEEVKRLLEQ